MATSYDIVNYFASGKTREWAEYVDRKENGGNGNGFVDGKEVSLFTKIISHRYGGYEYSFDRLDSEQKKELVSMNDDKMTKALYMNATERHGLGMAFSNGLDGITVNYNGHKHLLNQLANFPVETQKYEVLRDFLLGYEGGKAKNGIFEQMGSEWGDAFKNEDVLPFMKALLDNVPEEKKNTKEYKFLQKTYNEYNSRQKDDAFTDSKFAIVSSLFGLNTLDNLDEAINRLYDIP